MFSGLVASVGCLLRFIVYFVVIIALSVKEMFFRHVFVTTFMHMA